jgi:hypothetical protein
VWAGARHGGVLLKTFMYPAAGELDCRYEVLCVCQGCIHEISFSEFGHYIIEELLRYYTFE